MALPQEVSGSCLLCAVQYAQDIVLVVALGWVGVQAARRRAQPLPHMYSCNPMHSHMYFLPRRRARLAAPDPEKRAPTAEFVPANSPSRAYEEVNPAQPYSLSPPPPSTTHHSTTFLPGTVERSACSADTSTIMQLALPPLSGGRLPPEGLTRGGKSHFTRVSERAVCNHGLHVIAGDCTPA